MKWKNSPQYLKGIQRIKAMDPQDRAVASTLIGELDSLYADRDMKEQLRAMDAAALGKERDRQYDLSKERFEFSKKMGEADLGMAKDARSFMKDSQKTAENLGWANVGLSGLFGVSDMMEKRKKANRYESLMEKLR